MIYLRANNVLVDCELAHQLLRETYHTDRWRIQWVGAMALIRAVGHVLYKCDRKEMPELAHAIDSAFVSWKKGDEHRIFREFIDQERNNILKQYSFSTNDLSGVRLTPVQEGSRKLVTWLRDENCQHVPHYEADDGPFRPQIRGYREGDNAADVYQEAIDWWRGELNTIVSEFGPTLP